MKFVRYTFLLSCLSMLVGSCSMFKPKYGCPSSGRNVGAERAMDMTKKEKRKAGKFKA